jgi:hypothetical protein
MIGATGAQDPGNGLPNTQGYFGRDWVFVRLTADAVCAEELGRHVVIGPFAYLLTSPNDRKPSFMNDMTKSVIKVGDLVRRSPEARFKAPPNDGKTSSEQMHLGDAWGEV